MTAREFIKAVNAYGVHVPHGIAGAGGQTQFYKRVFGFPDLGQGRLRDYSASNVREVVAWSLWVGLTGQSNMDAVHLLSNQDSGWVVMSDNGVEWVEEVPPSEIFVGGAICVPVPMWVA